ncbi:MAG: FadR/GntR family transcriptional regulator [Pseudolabrys sp.]|jgi:GntR family transcriptional regulator, transcriptional repressor for pyruvate dehydrogenase complex
MTKAQSSVARRSAASGPFSPLKSGRKSDQVFEQISKFIHAGRFPPGGRLPAERELTTIFNTSRQTIREAIYRAELVGLVEVRHGAGSFVVSRTPQVAPDRPLMDLIKIEAHRVGEFFEIRRALEGWCASQAAKVGSKSHLSALKSRLDAMRDLDVTDDAWEENDIGFHKALAAATGNPLAVRIMDILRESFSAFYRLKRYIPNSEEQKTIWQHHVDIYDAVRERAPERAKAAIIAHMDFIEAKLAESLSDLGASKE